MKRVGLAAFDDKRAAFKDLSQTIQRTQIEQLNTQLSVFQNALSYFAVEHAKEIRTNPTFRAEFSKMCTAIGVDPLASSASKKDSMFASILGKDVNDFYFELAVRIIDVCRLTRDTNGGLITVDEVIDRLRDSKTQIRPVEVTKDDVERAVKSCNVLGSGFKLARYGHKTMIRSVPSELSSDQSTVLDACQAMGYVSMSILRDNFGWDRIRIKAVLDDLVNAGLLWIDGQGVELEYWAPSWISTTT